MRKPIVLELGHINLYMSTNKGMWLIYTDKADVEVGEIAKNVVTFREMFKIYNM